MKRNFIIGLVAASVIAGFTACSDDATVPSTMIDQSTVTSVSKPGEVVFHWTNPENPDYYYIKVKYNDPVKGEVVKTASAYADSIVIDGLYAKYGTLDYQFSAVSRDGGETSSFTVSAQAGPVAPAMISGPMTRKPARVLSKTLLMATTTLTSTWLGTIPRLSRIILW